MNTKVGTTNAAAAAAAAAAEAQLVVRSNIHLTNLDVAFRKLLQHEQFVDVTLSCDGVTFKCHRLILAASSPLFEKLFANNCELHPIVIIPLGIQAWTMQALIDFMYRGQVNVQECYIDELFESAKILQISSLCRTHMLPENNEYSSADSKFEYKNNSKDDNHLRSKTPNRQILTATEDAEQNDYSDSENVNANEEDFTTLRDQAESLNRSQLVLGESDVRHKSLRCNEIKSKERRRRYSEESQISNCEGQPVGTIRVKPKDMLFEGRNSSCNIQRLKMRAPPNCNVSTALRNLGMNFDDNDGGSVLQLKTEVEEDCNTTELRRCEQMDRFINTSNVVHSDKIQDNDDANDIHIKSEIIEGDDDYVEAENIVVQPNVSYIYSGHENFEENSNNIFNNYGNDESDFIENCHFKELFRTNFDYKSYTNGLSQYGLTSKSATHPILHKALAKSKMHQTKTSIQSNYTLDSLPKLRAPRSNQARNYCSKDLHNALMAVKHGDSIYNASRKYKVPRKTLRNWMKRMEIKSKFPMPKQLKDYTRKKQIDLAERQLQMQLAQQQDVFLT